MKIKFAHVRCAADVDVCERRKWIKTNQEGPRRSQSFVMTAIFASNPPQMNTALGLST